jgi:hypothetical protein
MDRPARIVAGEEQNMTQEDIIRMAREAGLYEDGKFFVLEHGELTHFAALVAAAEVRKAVMAERAACADICDQHASIEGIAQRCAAEIRARSKI